MESSLEEWTALVMVVVLSYNHRSQQVRNPSMSFFSDCEELCQLALTLFSDRMTKTVRGTGKDSLKKHQDNTTVSFASVMTCETIPTESSGNKG